MFLKNSKKKISYLKDLFFFKYKASKAKCILGKARMISNPQYIELQNNVKIKDNYRIECYHNYAGASLNPKLKIGNNVIIGYNFSCLVANHIEIGNDTILASDILITSENHGMNPESVDPYYKQPLSTGPVKIGNGVWIGEKVTILPGVTIGDKSIIAAGSIISKDIPPYSIAGGGPAKVLKVYNFESHCWERVK
jgi:lipopolysaccharide O-acetyltransferase